MSSKTPKHQKVIKLSKERYNFSNQKISQNINLLSMSNLSINPNQKKLFEDSCSNNNLSNQNNLLRMLSEEKLSKVKPSSTAFYTNEKKKITSIQKKSSITNNNRMFLKNTPVNSLKSFKLNLNKYLNKYEVINLYFKY